MDSINGITSQSYGQLPSGEEVTAFQLTSESGSILTVLDYGCTVTSLQTPDKKGVLGDIVLGYSSLHEYLASPHYMGAVIGRCAGRISRGKFSTEEKAFLLTRNAPPHHLHGGANGFDKKIWKAQPFENPKGIGIDFYLRSPDGDEGYPGNVTVQLRYYLTHSNALIITWLAETDQPTIFNPTQHIYWNLSGKNETVLGHGMQIHADRYLPVDAETIPTGERAPVEDTPFDFRQPVRIYDLIKMPHPQMEVAAGYDHCFVLNKEADALSNASMLYDPESARLLLCHTTEPGLQVYSGNGLYGKGRDGNEYKPFTGICFEAQHFPDAPNHRHFPSILLMPEKYFQSTTVFEWRVLS